MIRWVFMSMVLVSATKVSFADEASPHTFVVPNDLRFELLLREPRVRQPVHLSFNERGRL